MSETNQVLTLELSEQKCELLSEVLGNYISDMHSEIADTDNMHFKHMLQRRLHLLEEIAETLRAKEAAGVGS